jgi:hypothetical protein
MAAHTGEEDTLPWADLAGLPTTGHLPTRAEVDPK